MDNTAFAEWLHAKAPNATHRELGNHLNVSHTTIRRQLNGESALDAVSVIRLARAYQLNVLEALVAAGFLTEEEASTPSIEHALKAATDIELAREILRRAEYSAEFDKPVSETANVTPIKDARRFTAEERTEYEAGRYAASNDETINQIDPDLL